MVPLIVAVIAGLVSIFGFIITRGTKVSDFRQAWINAQRDDLATVLSQARNLALPKSDKRNESAVLFDFAYDRIRLRENPVKREWEDVIGKLEALRTAVNGTTKGADIEPEIDAIVRASQRLLKTEWNKVRRGELGYRILLVSVSVFVFALAWLLWTALPGSSKNSSTSPASHEGRTTPAKPATPAKRLSPGASPK